MRLQYLAFLTTSLFACTGELARPIPPGTEPVDAPVAAPGPSTVVTATPSQEPVAAPRLVVMGGDEGDARTATATVFTMGIGEEIWRSDASLPAARSSHTSVAVGASLLVLAGSDRQQLRREVWRSVEGDGAIVAWRKVATVDAGVANAAVAANGKGVVLVGGVDDFGPRVASSFAPLSAEGLPAGMFQAASALPSARSQVVAARLGNYAVAAGGLTTEGPTGEVLVARVGADGAPRDWKAASSLPVALSGHAGAASGDHLFVAGGGAFSRDVFAAQLDDAGVLGSWKASTPMPRGRRGHCVAVSGSRLFVVGGMVDEGGGEKASKDVFAADVKANGELGPWTKLADLPEPRAHAACAVQ